MKILAFVLIALIFWGQSVSARENPDGAQPKALSLMILAFRPDAQTRERWAPSIEYLAQALQRPIEIRIGHYDDIERAVETGEVDLLLTNSAHLVALMNRRPLTKLATVAIEVDGQTLNAFGGVILAPADGPIRRLEDLAGRKVATPSMRSLGGYQAQKKLLLEHDLDAERDLRLVVTGMPHDTAIQALLDGEAEAAFVRTGILEQMRDEGHVDASALRVIHSQRISHFPLALSTRLYPEWTLAALPHLPMPLQRQIPSLLLAMPAHDEAAYRSQHWTPPPSNLPVVRLLERLALPPFDDPAIENHSHVRPLEIIAVAMVAITLLVIIQILHGQSGRGGHLAGTNTANRKEKTAKDATSNGEKAALSASRLPEQLGLDALLSGSPTIIYALEVSPPYPVRYVSPNVRERLGHEPADILEDPRWLDIHVHLDDRDRLLQRFARWIEDGMPDIFRARYRIRHKNGGWVWVSNQCRPWRDEDGNTRYILGSSSDINDEVQDEQRLETITRHLPGVVFQLRLNSDGHFELAYISERVRDLRPDDEGAASDNSDLLSLIHPEDRLGATRGLLESASMLSTWKSVFRVRLHNQRIRWLQAQARPERESGGETIWHGQLADITEQRRRQIVADAINRLLSSFMERSVIDGRFGDLLADVLLLTNSPMGFVGEVLPGETGQPALHMRAMLGFPRTAAAKRLHEAKRQEGFLFENLNNLLGAPLRQRQPIIINDADKLPPVGLLPEGHPPLERFAGLPILWDGEPVGVIGLANCPHDYSPLELSDLDPLLGSVGSVIAATRIAAREADMQDRLRQALDQKQLLLESLGEGVYGVDRQGRTTFINAIALELLGFSENEVIGEDGHALFHHHHADGRHYPHEDCPIYQTLQDGEIRKRGLEHFVHKNGEVLPINMTVAPMRGKDTHHDEVRGAVVVFRDIRQQQAAEARIRLLGAAVEAAGNGIVITDPEGRLVWVNHAFETLTGFSRHEALGRKPSELVKSGKQDTAFYERLWRTIESGKVWEGELINRRKDGSEYHENLVISPVLDDRGRIQNYVGIKQDISERKATEAEMQRLATTDVLTGLPNRRYFLQRLETELARFRRYGKPASLMMLDLDHFKRVNDAHGHAAGDEVLRAFATRLREVLREVDIPGRLGGEEFAVFLPGTDAQGASQTAERLRQSVAAQRIKVCPDTRLSVTVSIGISVLHKDDKGIEAVLARADDALYRAKENGRDRVECQL